MRRIDSTWRPSPLPQRPIFTHTAVTADIKRVRCTLLAVTSERGERESTCALKQGGLSAVHVARKVYQRSGRRALGVKLRIIGKSRGFLRARYIHYAPLFMYADFKRRLTRLLDRVIVHTSSVTVYWRSLHTPVSLSLVRANDPPPASLSLSVIASAQQ